jgi:hypothetical protein
MRRSRSHTGVRARTPALADRTQLPMSKSDLLARPIYHHKATRSKPTPPSSSPPSRSAAGWNARPVGRSRSSSSPPPLPRHRDPHGRAHSPRLAAVDRRQGWSSPLHSEQRWMRQRLVRLVGLSGLEPLTSALSGRFRTPGHAKRRPPVAVNSRPDKAQRSHSGTRCQSTCGTGFRRRESRTPPEVDDRPRQW